MTLRFFFRRHQLAELRHKILNSIYFSIRGPASCSLFRVLRMPLHAAQLLKSEKQRFALERASITAINTEIHDFSEFTENSTTTFGSKLRTCSAAVAPSCAGLPSLSVSLDWKPRENGNAHAMDQTKNLHARKAVDMPMPEVRPPCAAAIASATEQLACYKGIPSASTVAASIKLLLEKFTCEACSIPRALHY
jgi:hypothetical protein